MGMSPNSGTDALSDEEIQKRPVSIGVILRWIGGITAIIAMTVLAVLSWSGVTSTINTNHMTATAQFNTLLAQIAALQVDAGQRQVEIDVLRKQVELMATAAAVDHFDQAGLNAAVKDVTASVQSIKESSIKQSAKIDVLVEVVNELKTEIRKR